MTAVHLCGAQDLDRLLAMVARCHEERGLHTDDDHCRAALAPLLDGAPHGAAWILGPLRAPVGYVVVTFSWSLERGGMVAALDDIWIRPSVRGRGLAVEAIHAVGGALRQGGVRALSVAVDTSSEGARRLFEKARFQPRDGLSLMALPL